MGTLVNTFKQWGLKLKETWGSLSLNQKVMAAAGVLFLAVAGLMLVISTTDREFQALYTDLDVKDAAAIRAILEEEQIEYQLADNGTTILVPEELKYSTRLTLAGENLPQGEVGFELFHESSFGETQTDKKVKYQEALQGELARTIQRLDKVKAARVNLALPEQTLFSDDETSTKASVVINTEAGETLSARDVQAVVNLVANSVERLDAENVVVVDQYGTLLTDTLPLQEGLNADRLQFQMALKREYEKEKQNAIQSMLDKTLGKENSVVRVNAQLNFDDKEQVEEIYSHDPEGPFIRSEETYKESSSGTTAGGEAPGTDTNIPEYTENTGGEGTSTHDSSSASRTYEINRTETTTRYAPGDVEYDYLTISVLVNNTAAQNSGLGETEEAKAATIRNIAATACGLRENRADENVNLEDSISVAFIDFYTEPEPEPVEQGTVDKLLKAPYTPVLLAFLGLLVIVLLGLLLRRSRSVATTEESFEVLVDEDISLDSIMERKLTPEEREQQRIKEEVDNLVDKSPEDAAQVIKAWLSEE